MASNLEKTTWNRQKTPYFLPILFFHCFDSWDVPTESVFPLLAGQEVKVRGKRCPPWFSHFRPNFPTEMLLRARSDNNMKIGRL